MSSKHIFWIHSHMTYHISNSIIETNKLNLKDVIFIFSRNYKQSIKKQNALPLHCEIKLKPFTLLRKPFKSYKNFKNYLNEINSLTDSKFQLYIPHSLLAHIAYLINHKNCLSFNYIEEGLASYNPKSFTSLNNTKPLNKFIFKLLSLKEINDTYFILTHKKLNFCYAINKNSFKSFNNTIILSDVFKKLETRSDIKNILVFDAILCYGEISSELYLELLERIIKHLSERNQFSIHFKFHPEQYLEKNKNERQLIYSIFEKHPHIQFIELSRDSFIESILYSDKDICLYTYIYLSIF